MKIPFLRCLRTCLLENESVWKPAADAVNELGSASDRRVETNPNDTKAVMSAQCFSAVT